MESRSRGLILMERAIFFSSSSCSLVLVISRQASPASWPRPLPDASSSPRPPWPSSRFHPSSASPGLPPFIDVLFEGLIESCLGGCLVLPIRGHNSFTDLLLPGLPPFIDVLFEGLIESCLGGCLVLPIRGHNS